MRRTEELTQNALDGWLIEIVCLEERRKETSAKLASWPKHNGTGQVVKSLAEAREVEALKRAEKEADADMHEAAAGAVRAGVPLEMWFSVERIGQKEARVRFFDTSGRPGVRVEVPR